MDPADPTIVYAGMWRFDRKPWTYTSGSEKAACSGRRMEVLLGGDYPWSAVAAWPDKHQDCTDGYEDGLRACRIKGGTLFRSRDGGTSFKRVSSDRELVGRAYYFTDLRVAPDNADHVMVLADALLESRDGGEHFSRMSPGIHGDLHALWIDPKDVRRIWQGMMAVWQLPTMPGDIGSRLITFRSASSIMFRRMIGRPSMT